MNVKSKEEELVISLSSPLDTRPKIFYLIQAVVYVLPVLAVAFGLFKISVGVTGVAIESILGLLLLMISFRFCEQAFQSEKLILRGGTFILERNGLLKRRSAEYSFEWVSEFQFLPKRREAKHPLAGTSFDYLGFQTEQQLINRLHDDDRVAFCYKGKIISFGRDLTSWHFEELTTLLAEHSGRDLSARTEEEISFDTQLPYNVPSQEQRS